MSKHSKSKHRSKTYRFFRKFFLFLLAIPVALLLLVVLIHLPNTIIEKSFAAQLFRYPLPPQTLLLEKHSICGRLYGTGDGMEFMAVILIESDLTEDQLTTYYQRAPFRKAQPNDAESLLTDFHLTITPVTAEPFCPDYCGEAFFTFRTLSTKTDYKNLYYIAIHNGTYPNFLDLRGT